MDGYAVRVEDVAILAIQSEDFFPFGAKVLRQVPAYEATRTGYDIHHSFTNRPTFSDS